MLIFAAKFEIYEENIALYIIYAACNKRFCPETYDSHQ